MNKFILNYTKMKKLSNNKCYEKNLVTFNHCERVPIIKPADDVIK
jgi:hypothetical protein